MPEVQTVLLFRPAALACACWGHRPGKNVWEQKRARKRADVAMRLSSSSGQLGPGPERLARVCSAAACVSSCCCWISGSYILSTAAHRLAQALHLCSAGHKESSGAPGICAYMACRPSEWSADRCTRMLCEAVACAPHPW